MAILPLDLLLITLTSSIGSLLPPPMIRTFFRFSDLGPVILHASATSLSLEGSLAFPSIITGSITFANFLTDFMFFWTISESDIFLSIAGATIIGVLAPIQVSATSMGGLSPIPFTIFPRLVAQQGVIINKSASCPAITCSTCPVISLIMGFPQANSSDFSPTSSRAARLATTVTLAPYLSSSRMIPTVSTQDTDPVTPTQTFLSSR